MDINSFLNLAGRWFNGIRYEFAPYVLYLIDILDLFSIDVLLKTHMECLDFHHIFLTLKVFSIKNLNIYINYFLNLHK